jgi:hypothetical protein
VSMLFSWLKLQSSWTPLGSNRTSRRLKRAFPELAGPMRWLVRAAILFLPTLRNLTP